MDNNWKYNEWNWSGVNKNRKLRWVKENDGDENGEKK